MKIIGILKNNCITGVEYGLIEVADTKGIPSLQKKNKKNNEKKIKKNKKHVSDKNVRIKTAHVEKETKTAAPKKTKRRYRIHATITLSYNFKSSQKHVDLSKKQFTKAKDLFKKKQRKGKITAQNVMMAMNFIEPVLKTLEQQIQKTR